MSSSVRSHRTQSLICSLATAVALKISAKLGNRTIIGMFSTETPKSKCVVIAFLVAFGLYIPYLTVTFFELVPTSQALVRNTTLKVSSNVTSEIAIPKDNGDGPDDSLLLGIPEDVERHDLTNDPVEVSSDVIKYEQQHENLTSGVKIVTEPETTKGPQNDNLYHEGQSGMTIDEWMESYRNKGTKPNVLFIIADDYRPEIRAQIHEKSPWIEPSIHTPNLDKLASEGVLFRRAYCQFSWCNPSRSSLLTSRRPETTMVHNNSVFFRQANPDFVTLPQYFRENGHQSYGIGKIFHLMTGTGVDNRDTVHSWSEPMPKDKKQQKFVLDEGPLAWRAVGRRDRGGKLLLDEFTAKEATKTMRRLAYNKKKYGDPFFFAVGIKKPHLSFVFPEEYLDYYPLKNITMPSNPIASPSLPDIAWFSSFEIRGRKEYLNDTQNWEKDKPLKDWIVRELRRAYYSSVTYIDHLIGKIIGQVNDLDIANDTVIAFIGDHGFHLGEHSIIGKNTAFEVANNSPMIIKVPGVTHGGHVTDKLVEFVDIFPTLAELAGLPDVPYCPGMRSASRNMSLCTEGTSLVPLLRDLKAEKWKDRIFYQYPHYAGHGSVWCMGFSMRTEQYRYTEWIRYDYSRPAQEADWEDVCGIELYDHHEDPHETTNLAEEVSLEGLRKELRTKLRSGWHEALPT